MRDEEKRSGKESPQKRADMVLIYSEVSNITSLGRVSSPLTEKLPMENKFSLIKNLIAFRCVAASK